MPASIKTPEGFSLKRWSRRKLEAGRESHAADTGAGTVAPPAPIGATEASMPVATNAGIRSAATEAALPPVESLTIDSDFTAFLQPEVDEAVKRQALKRLFADPRFNVMDGLDVYIDDYTKFDPIPPDILERLMKHFDFMSPAVASELPPEPAAVTPTLAHEAPPPTIEPRAAELPDASESHSDAEADARDPHDPPPSR